MKNQFYKKFQLYQLAVIFSLLFSLVGFSYNVWRMEISEENNNIRTACFEMLINLSSLEQLIYTAYYDGNTLESSPRIGWVKVGLIGDLSALTDQSVEKSSTILKASWSAHWNTLTTNQDSVDALVIAIDSVRTEIKGLLTSLE
tara:strand:- start:46319 stop:46750 length:432 start_codon:yes stop_codon:yes gene_type:complete